MAYPFVVAIIALAVAPFLFYEQRSLLALYLGQISLAGARLVAPRPPCKDEWTVFEWIDETDSWTIRHQVHLAGNGTTSGMIHARRSEFPPKGFTDL
jgi:hypothetical protein